MDNFLLMAMAYDLYTATCQPLHYSMVMSMPVCALMLGSSWPLANFHSLLPTLLVARLEFCASNVIPYSFCDLAPLIQLSCPNTQLNQLMILLEGGPGGPHPLPWHSRLLHPHCVCCATGAICPGQTKGLFHLWLPPCRGHSLLWDHHRGLPESLILPRS